MTESIFSCKRCGYCCHGDTTVSLTKVDQAAMLHQLQITQNEAEKLYWRVTENCVQMKVKDGHCIFYNDGCTIHKARPQRCREWPLVSAIVKDRVNLQTIQSSCPGMNADACYDEVCRAIKNTKVEKK